MNIAICDDEKDYRSLIFQYVNFYFNEKNIPFSCAEFSSAEELISHTLDFDIVFLDIEMEKISGLTAAEKINSRNRNTVIFVITAFNKYLDDAMDLNVFRFIDKSRLSSERIYRSLDKALELLERGEIMVKTTENEIVKLPKKDIMYVEVNKHKTSIKTTEKTFETFLPIFSIKKNLVSEHYIVPHNSYIVNLEYVKKYTHSSFIMADGYEILISQKKRAEVKKLMFTFTADE